MHDWQSIRPNWSAYRHHFPGNLFSALRCGQYIKEHFPHTRVALGGGFANTELRSITDPRVFEFLDFITLDDGELPVELLHQYTTTASTEPIFKRTFHLRKRSRSL